MSRGHGNNTASGPQRHEFLVERSRVELGLMSEPNDDSLPVLLNSIQSRLVSSQRQLSIVNAQIKARAREARLQELTMEQLKGLGSETRVYKAVGKMCVWFRCTDARFMQESFQEAMDEAQKRRSDALEENKMLEKKCKVRHCYDSCQFYEKEAVGAQTHLNDLITSMKKANVA